MYLLILIYKVRLQMESPGYSLSRVWLKRGSLGYLFSRSGLVFKVRPFIVIQVIENVSLITAYTSHLTNP